MAECNGLQEKLSKLSESMDTLYMGRCLLKDTLKGNHDVFLLLGRSGGVKQSDLDQPLGTLETTGRTNKRDDVVILRISEAGDREWVCSR